MILFFFTILSSSYAPTETEAWSSVSPIETWPTNTNGWWDQSQTPTLTESPPITSSPISPSIITSSSSKSKKQTFIIAISISSFALVVLVVVIFTILYKRRASNNINPNPLLKENPL